jgi:hypothetical protein
MLEVFDVNKFIDFVVYVYYEGIWFPDQQKKQPASASPSAAYPLSLIVACSVHTYASTSS